jgi:dTDP-D-glucose 4,6-dehydratase
LLGWSPKIPLNEGLKKAVAYFAERQKSSHNSIENKGRIEEAVDQLKTIANKY